VFGFWCGAVYVMMDFAIFCAGFDREKFPPFLDCAGAILIVTCLDLGFVSKDKNWLWIGPFWIRMNDMLDIGSGSNSDFWMIE